MTSAGRYAGRPRETWVVRPSARVLERRAAWAARAQTSHARVRPSRGGAQVGASIWQTPGGVVSEIKSINSDFVVFANEFEGFLTNRGYPAKVEPALRPLVELFEHVWRPLLKEWRSFFEDNDGWWDNFWWNHAPEAEKYQARLVEVRARAKELGMSPRSPTPAQFAPSLLFDPSRNLFDRIGDGAQSALADLWGVVKVALYGGLAIAGGYVIFTLARQARDKGAPQ